MRHLIGVRFAAVRNSNGAHRYDITCALHIVHRVYVKHLHHSHCVQPLRICFQWRQRVEWSLSHCSLRHSQRRPPSYGMMCVMHSFRCPVTMSQRIVSLAFLMLLLGIMAILPRGATLNHARSLLLCLYSIVSSSNLLIWFALCSSDTFIWLLWSVSAALLWILNYIGRNSAAPFCDVFGLSHGKRKANLLFITLLVGVELELDLLLLVEFLRLYVAGLVLFH